ncbi:MAG: hypothetical protein IJ869_03300 [Clostridiales bacterium]|nr:hypothetical protein [Clostridiales bacterium]
MKRDLIKRYVTILTTVSLVAGLIPMTVFADETEIEETVPAETEEPAETSEETVLSEETIPSEETVLSEETIPSEETALSEETIPSEETEPTEISEEIEEIEETEDLIEITNYILIPDPEGGDPEYYEYTEYVEEIEDQDVSAQVSPICSTLEEAGAFMREQMVNRETSFTLRVDYELYNTDGVNFVDIFHEAVKHTGVPGEGDNLDCTFGGANASSKVYYSDDLDGFVLELYCTVSYYTTKSQEDTFTKAANNLISSLNLSGKSDYEKIFAVYSWMTENIDYDYDHYQSNEDYDLQYTAYAALVDRTCVCQGYANLFYYLMLKLGIDCRVVAGGNHAFNIVALKGKYYYVDSTWDEDGLNSYGYKWFLTGSEFFLTEHSLYDTPARDMVGLVSKYNVSATDYFTGLNPGAMTASYTSGGIKLTWKKVDQADGYLIYIYDTSLKAYKQIASVSSVTYTVPYSTATKGTFKVRPYRRAGYGEANKYCNFSTKSINMDISGFSLTTSGTSSVKLTWDKNSNAQCYEVWRANSADGPWTKINTITATSYTNSGLDSGTAYFYRVRGYVSFNGTKHYGAYSSTKFIAPKPEAPLYLFGDPVSNSVIDLTWESVPGADGYEVWRSVSPDGPFVCICNNCTDTSRTCTNLEAATQYYFKVRAYNDYGSVRVYGEYVSGTALETAVGITNIGRNGASGASFYIEWTPAHGAEGYEVSRATSSNGPYTVIGTTRGTRFNDSTAVPGQKYFYRVRAYAVWLDMIYYRQYSNPRAIMAPLTPSGLTLTAVSSSQINLSWTGVPGGANIYYEVWRSSSSSFTNAVCLGRYSATNSTSRLLNPNTRYYYRVRAYYLVPTTDPNNPKRIYGSYTSISSCVTKK